MDLVLALQGAGADGTLLHRWQFGINLVYHYLYPQLTMGLILFIVILETLYLKRGNETYKKSANFWVKIFAPAFIIGAVTGIPLEFGFGTNWALFSTYAGGVIGQTLAMEGVFAFFLESAFLGLYLYGGDSFGRRIRWFSAFMVLVGTWASGYFVLTVNSFMQHPVGYERLANGNLGLESFWAILFNPWMSHQYLHVMGGTVVVGAFAFVGVGAFYLLSNRDVEYGRIFVTLGVIVGLAASVWQLYPSGDLEGVEVAKEQPTKLAAMEGLFETEGQGAPFTLIGQINVEEREIENPIEIPYLLSFLSYRAWTAEVQGLEAFSQSQWPDNIPLVYYAYRIMIGTGTIFIAIMGLAALLLWRGRLFRSRKALWLLMLAAPFPFIANTTGWMTTEIGRQPWIVWGLKRTSEAASPTVSPGTVYFTIVGLLGLFLLLSLLFLMIVFREVGHGPDPAPDDEETEEDVLTASRMGD